MRAYTVETRNFSFIVFADSHSGYVRALRKAWQNHCEKMNVHVDGGFLATLISDYEGNYVEVEKGAVYRDYERIV
jgi:hypothetical protein